ncbi:MAG: succinate dehydrogenase assembly factor 2 [Gammaproteobacteria bacterium]
MTARFGGARTNGGQNDATHRARLYWQCRRGMLELDLVLQAFLDHQYQQATPEERRAFETLLNYPDSLLFEYVMGRMTPTDQQLANVVVRLRSPTAA